MAPNGTSTPGVSFDVPILPTPGMAQGGLLLPVPYISQNPAKNLCWAACCEMVLRANNITDKRICDIAGLLAGYNCCPDPMSAGGDQAQSAEDAFHHCAFPFQGPLYYAFEWQGLVNEIQIAHRPVEILYHWNDGIQHLALLIGIHSTGYLFVNDPWKGWGWVKYEDVLNAYGLGKWLYTYQAIGGSLDPLT
jgi:Papain-like cysteine protease AvrRpt2